MKKLLILPVLLILVACDNHVEFYPRDLDTGIEICKDNGGVAIWETMQKLGQYRKHGHRVYVIVTCENGLQYTYSRSDKEDK